MPADNVDTLFIQFARSPVRGEVKTRMIPHLSASQAMSLHCELVRWTACKLVSANLGTVQLAVAGDCCHSLFDECRAMGVAEVIPQVGDGLGERMYRALQHGLESYASVVLVGSDCPGLDAGYLARAVSALGRARVVLGPAVDGGYVLIGATEISADVFTNIDWGSASVYRQTVARLEDQDITWSALAEKRDIDRPEDLPHWEAMRQRVPG